jgi:hypothetical protein
VNREINRLAVALDSIDGPRPAWDEPVGDHDIAVDQVTARALALGSGGLPALGAAVSRPRRDMARPRPVRIRADPSWETRVDHDHVKLAPLPASPQLTRPVPDPPKTGPERADQRIRAGRLNRGRPRSKPKSYFRAAQGRLRWASAIGSVAVAYSSNCRSVGTACLADLRSLQKADTQGLIK